MKKQVNTQESTITWKGKKITGSHEGTIQLKEGFLEFGEDGNLIGGKFIMDMTSIEVTDLKGDSKGQLEGHLKSADFFGIENHPTSTLVITDTNRIDENKHKVTGDLSIKESTHPITFELSINENSATTTLKVDRTKYGIRYGSGSFFDNLGDNTIYDDFILNVNLKF